MRIPKNMTPTLVNGLRDKTHQPHASSSVNQIYFPRHLSNPETKRSHAGGRRDEVVELKEEKGNQLGAELYGGILVTLLLPGATSAKHANATEGRFLIRNLRNKWCAVGCNLHSSLLFFTVIRLHLFDSSRSLPAVCSAATTVSGPRPPRNDQSKA